MGNVSYQGVKVVDNDSGVAEITADNHLQTINMGQLVPEVYDTILITYNGDDTIDAIQYKTGGALGTLVAGLTMGYTDGLLALITRT
tara:strand:+ start:326 stop:586 length:261 start_codon:yes stop_codon:yes gene_type:complete